MFREILTLLIDAFTSVEEKTYISFATDAINVIYHVSKAVAYFENIVLTENFIILVGEST